ncbi:MAG: hypothetical protein IIX67_02325 [Clostridia bacterium]|nr:hypothetical protein [Clostridia bacterium]
MKRLVTFIIAICIVMSIIPLSVSAEEDYSDFEHAVAQLRESMVKRDTKITLYCKSDKAITRDDLGELFNLAIEETEKPDEGDYLHWHIEGYRVYGEYWVFLGVYRYTLTYEVSYYTTAEQEAEVDKAVDELLSQFAFTESTDDHTKAKTVYSYICENVDYYYGELRTADQKLKYTAYSALINKTAVCQGYASLYYRLLRELGINCRTITGQGNGGNHAWNIVEVDGVYFNADTTWDAVSNKNRYFLKCEDHFTDHVRNEEYTGEAFLNAYPMAEKCYDVLHATPDCEKDGHDFDDWFTTLEATCLESGEKRRDCKHCDFYEIGVISARGHTDGDWTTVKEPEIGVPGSEELRCADCNALLSQREIAALTPEDQPVLGDLNGNGRIDKYDYILVKRIVMGTVTVDESLLPLADVNKDGKVDTYDYILLKRHVMGTYVIEDSNQAA